MKIAAIRSRRLYKIIMLGTALLLFIFAFVISSIMNKQPREKTTIDEPPNPPSMVVPSKPVFKKAAALQLDKDPNELTKKDFARITELSVGRMLKPIELYDIKPLKKFLNLQELSLIYLKCPQEIPRWKSYLGKIGIIDLSKKPSLDLSPIKKLTKLRRLEIYDTSVSDIRPLAGLTQLESLDLFNTQISDVKALRRLRNLQTLIFHGTPAFDLEPLSGLTNLRELSLIRTDISNLEPLERINKPAKARYRTNKGFRP